ncbi:MAG: OmpH family outer membrane protein [Pseudomonadales bacterium]|nr:OmpH family outer membrane protein [Pseudomonadales bacterium]MDP4875517.1 OmpH family outer membrane protein [Pseudomonadales bacterium]MDP4912687.1 OmpH family outer membrane protein [Pseudomonadales bacterium]MDP5060085.1 OmpH family outer membrane protein [Pseudomonadales bacterium]
MDVQTSALLQSTLRQKTSIVVVNSVTKENTVQIKQSILANTFRAILASSALMMVFAAPAAVAEVKIAVVDVQAAILNSEEAKRLLAQIQEEFKDEEEKIRNIQTEAAVLFERMQKDAEVMSEAEKRRVQQQIESKNNDFVYNRQKLQRLIEERQQELFAGIDQKVQSAIEELVKSDDYDLIVPRQAALYVSEIYNITRKVTEKLNQMSARKN